MIEIEGLSKRFGAKSVLDHVSFTAEDGKVTGFLGPNGAGKSTTMRAALGLIAPDAGRALIDGRPFAEHRAPLRAVGAVLDAKSAHKAQRLRPPAEHRPHQRHPEAPCGRGHGPDRHRRRQNP